MASEKAMELAAQCWCKPKTRKKQMDVTLSMEFAKVLDRYIKALQWCSGSQDFQIDGKARRGWEKICKPLI